MKYYIELTLLPDVDISMHFLWEKVYSHVHASLVDIKNGQGKQNVGVSFPKYNLADKRFPLGDSLRLLSTDNTVLERLGLRERFHKLRDYIQVSLVLKVPNAVDGYAIFKRAQFKSNNLRLARRYAKRNSVSLEDAVLLYLNREEQRSDLPYIWVSSSSTGQKYQLFIQQHKQDSSTAESVFNTYGLSANSTVPLFVT